MRQTFGRPTELLLLIDVAEFNYQAVAEILGIPQSSIALRASEAREQFDHQLGVPCPGELARLLIAPRAQ